MVSDESGHEELRKRDKMVPEVKPETEKPRKKSLRRGEPLCLSLSTYLTQLILKSHFTERQF